MHNKNGANPVHPHKGAAKVAASNPLGKMEPPALRLAAAPKPPKLAK